MNDGRSEPNSKQTLDDLVRHLQELRDYGLLYVETRKDQIRLRVRQALVLSIVGSLLLLMAACGVVVAVVLMLSGVAGGVASLLDDRLWAGQLITGSVVVLGACLTLYLIMRGITKSGQRRTTEKYERRRQELRNRFGRDASPRCEVESHS